MLDDAFVSFQHEDYPPTFAGGVATAIKLGNPRLTRRFVRSSVEFYNLIDVHQRHAMATFYQLSLAV